MEILVLMAGLLLVLYGLSALVGGGVAASRPLRAPGRPYGAAITVSGAVVLAAGIVWLLA